MSNTENNKQKVNYFKQVEDLLKNKTLEKLQKEIKHMRNQIDLHIKNANSPMIENKIVEKKEVVKAELVKDSSAKSFVRENNIKRENHFNDSRKTYGENEQRNLPYQTQRTNGDRTFKQGGFRNFEQRNGERSNYKPNNFKDSKFGNNRQSFANNGGIKKFVQNEKSHLNEFRRSAEAVAVNVVVNKNKFSNANKQKFSKEDYYNGNGKYSKNKNSNFDEENSIYSVGNTKYKKNKSSEQSTKISNIKKAVITGNAITVKEFSEKIGKSVSEIVKKLMLLGVMSNINSSIDFDTASLVAEEYGIELENKIEKTAEDILIDSTSEQDDEANLVSRPPIITVMGHVDHGKTSLLDAIRKTSIASNEAGGITQHIGAYTIMKNDRKITFIDTPGHEAFTAMRARGAKVTDIAILVVAADDGVKPQTIEAIDHIQKANVPMIVAINKIDAPQANIEKVKQQLAEHNVLPEEWGGEAILVPISAKTGQGLDTLLDMMLLVADMEDLKVNPNRNASAVVIESRLDRGRGPVATLLIQNGTLKIGNTVVCGSCMGKIRAMVDQSGSNVVSASPSYAVEVLGFNEVPKAGDIAQVVEEKLAKQIVQERKIKEQIEANGKNTGLSMDEFLNKMKDKTTLNLVVKTDVQGSLEAIYKCISDIKNEEVDIHCIHGGVGNVNENDILLAQTSNAMVVAFNVKVESKAQRFADKEGVQIKTYRIIYDMLDDINLAVKALVKPKYKEVFIGEIEIRAIYKITGAGLIAGCFVKKGAIRRNCIARIYRNDELIVNTVVDSVKIFKDDVKEATEGFECGVKLRDTSFKEGDKIMAYIEEEIKG